MSVLAPAFATAVATGAPGEKATWANGNKQGVGTSTMESRVWFTLGGGARPGGPGRLAGRTPRPCGSLPGWPRREVHDGDAAFRWPGRL
jgi:hypothetical protein